MPPLSSSLRKVPNEFPKYTNPSYKVAFIGEAPGSDEVSQGRPFVGSSGWLLWNDAGKYGFNRDSCFVGNVCQVQPPKNDILAFDWNGPEIQSGLATLTSDLLTYQPNLVVCLGNTPLCAFKGDSGISNWRGTLFHGQLNDPTRRFKCLATLHPASILREYTGRVFLDFDLKRASQEARTPDLILPIRNLRHQLSVDDQLSAMDDILHRKPEISIDLEGYWNNMTKISISESPTEGFLVKFHNHIPLEHEMELWRKLTLILKDREIKKVGQNLMYELFVLQYGHRIPVRGIVDDLMFLWWELYCELPKRLGVISSVCTREPYWKDDREDDSMEVQDLYCCTDSAVTLECRNVLRRQLSPASLRSYQFNVAMCEPLTYMQINGILYDQQKANQLKVETLSKIHRLQWALNEIAGCRLPSDPIGWFNICREVHSYKKDAWKAVAPKDLPTVSKLTELHRSQRCAEILMEPLGLSECGELSIHTDQGLNVDSPKTLAEFLYSQLGLPVQYKKERGRLTDKVTTDVGALLTLYRQTKDPTLKLILRIRGLRSNLETLEASTDPDGNMRCSYNQLKKKQKKGGDTTEGGPTSTGRLSCSRSLTGSGYNLQTATKKQRQLFIPPPGWFIFQCDLAGADGWTVAAHCFACGDPTMLEDYRYGLKPARIIALLYMFGSVVLTWDRAKLREMSKQIDSDGWLYFACKRVQHGSNYGMGKATMSDQILKDSYKLYGDPIFVAPETCERLQQLYFARYPGIASWHNRLKTNLLGPGKLTSASGHTRIFFGRRKDPNGRVNHDTFKEMAADEPQNNTTYATNTALLKLWTDPENRYDQEVAQDSGATTQRRRVALRIQPLHQVHDALIGQFRKTDVAWAVPRIRHYFNNRFVIAGVDIVIPFEGAYGDSWGSLKAGTI